MAGKILKIKCLETGPRAEPNNAGSPALFAPGAAIGPNYFSAFADEIPLPAACFSSLLKLVKKQAAIRLFSQ